MAEEVVKFLAGQEQVQGPSQHYANCAEYERLAHFLHHCPDGVGGSVESEWQGRRLKPVLEEIVGGGSEVALSNDVEEWAQHID